MEISSATKQQSFFSATNSSASQSSVIDGIRKEIEKKSEDIDNSHAQGYENFRFKNADELFNIAFERVTSSLPITDISLAHTKVEVSLVKFYNNKLADEIKQSLNDGEVLTNEIKSEILQQAKDVVKEVGFEGVDIKEFIDFTINNNSNNPLFKSDNTLFSQLNMVYTNNVLPKLDIAG